MIKWRKCIEDEWCKFADEDERAKVSEWKKAKRRRQEVVVVS